MNSFEYYEIAAIQIDKAIELFFSKDYICAITLAGAGEEILGKILAQCGETHVQEDIVRSVLGDKDVSTTRKEIHDMLNHSKNRLKHIPDMESGRTVPIKPVDDSLEIITRAIANYAKLLNSITPTMHRFAHDDDVNGMREKILQSLS